MVWGFYIVAVWKSNDENTLDGAARSCYNLGGVALNLEFHRRAEFRIPKGIFLVSTFFFLS